MTATQATYPDAPESLITHWERRRARLTFAPGEALPPLDVDLAALAAARLPAEVPPLAKPASPHAQKRHALMQELAGQSELALLNALLIAHLRKRRYPRNTTRLFRRIWVEQGPFLMGELSTRWLISSMITFADHGETEAQRRLRQSLNILFSLMKLYEYERSYTGLEPSRPFRNGPRNIAPLPLGMPEFALATGGLDINLLAPIWKEAQEEPVIGPLACHLLAALNADPGNLFRRITQMRVKLRRRRAARATAD
ncbi:hypothetical protein RNZ50_14155 [Paracoccaceae bacterium Fryx2]|nr:hypothetical protein [Paracoccaceae bacterium Fryx2]